MMRMMMTMSMYEMMCKTRVPTAGRVAPKIWLMIKWQTTIGHQDDEDDEDDEDHNDHNDNDEDNYGEFATGRSLSSNGSIHQDIDMHKNYLWAKSEPAICRWKWTCVVSLMNWGCSVPKK